jgi:broad specificity phosphatase PhoE
MSIDFNKLREESNKLRYWDDIIDFGKYEGKSIREVANEDPDYLNFLIKRTKRTDFSAVMFDEVQEAIENANHFQQVPEGWGDY